MTNSVQLEKQSTLKNLLLDALAYAKQQGASSAEASAQLYSGYSVNVRQGEIDTLEHHQDQSINLTVYWGQKTGATSTTDLRPESIRATVDRACAIAKLTCEDPYAGLPEKALMPEPDTLLDVDIYHPWSLDVQQAVSLAKACEAHGMGRDQRITNSEGVTINNTEQVVAYANSHGFVGSYPRTSHSIVCTLIAKVGDDMQRDYEYTSARSPEQLMPIDSLAEAAAKMTVDRLNAKILSSRQCPILMPARLARSFLGSFIRAISGGNLYRRASFLFDHQGVQIFPTWLTIQESAEIPGAIGSVPFDAEGVKPVPRTIVEDGVLKAYVLSSYSARKLGLQSTANAGGIHTVSFSHQDYNLADLMAQMDGGVLVTETMGGGVNLVTGDYSVGAFGFFVKGGEIQYPVHGITIAGNLKTLFRDIRAIGNDIDYRGKLHVGSLLLDNMTVAGR